MDNWNFSNFKKIDAHKSVSCLADYIFLRCTFLMRLNTEITTTTDLPHVGRLRWNGNGQSRLMGIVQTFSPHNRDQLNCFSQNYAWQPLHWPPAILKVLNAWRGFLLHNLTMQKILEGRKSRNKKPSASWCWENNSTLPICSQPGW